MEEGKLSEMCRRAAQRDILLFSRFLNLAEQEQGKAAARAEGAACRFFGGMENCERQVMGVGGDEAPETEAFPIVCIRIVQRGAKFAKKPLAHRDVLGALLGLGIDREQLGDIVIRPEGAYVFCMRPLGAFILSALLQVGSSTVECSETEAPEGAVRQLAQVRLQVASPRLDAVVAHLFKISRGDAQELFHQGRVAVNDQACLRPDYMLKEGQVVSVRGFGRGRYDGVEGVSKKGKSNLLFSLYQ
ncbi:MAG: YlmH/Sll1252 family protein [Clostridiales bacterium]|nr:YlmH/Sll1252 family protein [Clostridiales bacterium]